MYDALMLTKILHENQDTMNNLIASFKCIQDVHKIIDINKNLGMWTIIRTIYYLPCTNIGQQFSKSCKTVGLVEVCVIGVL